MNNIIQIKRRPLGGSPGAPTSLSGGEIAFNEVDKVLYYGYDGGTVHTDGNPGTIIGIAGPGLFVDRTTNQTVSGVKTFQSTISALGDVEVDGNVDAHTYSIDGSQIVNSSKDAFFANIDATGNLTVQGDFTVYGNSTVIETTVTAASAFKIEASGPTTALEVIQRGSAVDIAEFKDDSNTALIIKEGGNVGINTSAPNKTLTVVGDVSATGTLDIVSATTLQSTLDVTGKTTLNSTLDVINGATFASTLSARGTVEFDSTLTVDGTTTLNDDLTVIDYAVVKTAGFVTGMGGGAVTIDAANKKVTVEDGGYIVDYTSAGIDSTVNPNGFTITTANDSGNGIKFTPAVGSHTNVTQGNLVGNTLNKIEDFIIDGGGF
jgi:hypothetical protein